MRFVPVKEEHQQIILCLHRTRQGFVEERTATYNRLRGLISEFGIVLPLKVECLRREIIAHLEDCPAGDANQCVAICSPTPTCSTPASRIRPKPSPAARENERSKRLMALPASARPPPAPWPVWGGHDFKNGRQVAAWIGLVPGQYSSGGKTRLGRITKAGDAYMRSLLVMGARAILASVGDKQDRFSRWARVWWNDAGTGKPRSRLPPRMHGWRGRC
jgi:transposase